MKVYYRGPFCRIGPFKSNYFTADFKGSASSGSFSPYFIISFLHNMHKEPKSKLRFVARAFLDLFAKDLRIN